MVPAGMSFVETKQGTLCYSRPSSEIGNARDSKADRIVDLPMNIRVRPLKLPRGDHRARVESLGDFLISCEASIVRPGDAKETLR